MIRASDWVAIGLGSTLLAACAGATGVGPHAPTPGTTHGPPAQVVGVRARERFEVAARAMRAHDQAREGRGDWTAEQCAQVASQFEAAANAEPGGAFADAWFMRGMAFERCGMTDGARESFEFALRAAPRGRGHCRARAQLGVHAYRAGHPEQAMAAFEQAVREDPGCVEGYTNIATMLRERGEHARAVNAIRQALARDPEFLPALNQLALTYYAEAPDDDPAAPQLRLAAMVCSQAVQIAQHNRPEMTGEMRSYLADVFNTWGLVDSRANQIVRAIDHFTRAFQLNPDMFEAWVNYGTIHLSFRAYADARDAFHHAVELRPGSYDAHIGLGVALRGLGQVPEAQREYEHARAIDGDRPDAYYNLGLLYQNYVGNAEGLATANRYLTEFLAKAGNTPRYATAVQRALRNICNNHDALIQLMPRGAMLPPRPPYC